MSVFRGKSSLAWRLVFEHFGSFGVQAVCGGVDALQIPGVDGLTASFLEVVAKSLLDDGRARSL